MLGLEVFDSACPSLFDGTKKVSVREFPLPPEVLGKEVCVLSRPDPPAGRPLPDEQAAGVGGFKVEGVITFSASTTPYTSRAAFDADVSRHQVKPGSPQHAKYCGPADGPWPGPLGELFAWEISSARRVLPDWLAGTNGSPAIRRRFNAIFDVDTTASPRSKPRIAVFSGPQSTIANTAPLITSNQARQKRGLPLRVDAWGEPLRFDPPRLQRLAAPVEVLIAQFSEHPLSSDSAELHGPPDGWCDPKTGAFSSAGPQRDDWVPCYKATLRPEDGPLALPFMGVTHTGEPWDGPVASCGGDRQTFFPDASAMFTEIDRCGWNGDGDNNLMSSQAQYDFFRACPPAGYTKGQPAHRRTDVASVTAPLPDTPIPPEVAGEDFFRYYPYHLSTPPTAAALIEATNLVQRTLGPSGDLGAQNGPYLGAQWLEASCIIEETLYWLSLVIDTHKPIVGHSAQRPHGTIGNDGDINIVHGAKYICSRIWQGPGSGDRSVGGADGNDGRDIVGPVLVVDDQAFSAREVAKTDARPGNYAAVGGHGGVVAGLHMKPTLTFVPMRKATWRSELNLSRLPRAVAGLVPGGGGITEVQVLDADGALCVLPRVNIVKAGHYTAEAARREALAPFNGTRGFGARNEEVIPGETAKAAVGVLAELDAALREAPLCGFVAEGANPYAYVDENSMDAALLQAVFSGVPVCRVARGNSGGYTYPSGPFFIAGSNLTSTKARILLQAAILKLGMHPPAANPQAPTSQERAAIMEHVAAFQDIFDTH